VARHDVAIYSPHATAYYEDAAPTQGGGAEIQMTFLARELARRGLRVAHIVLPGAGPAEFERDGVTVHSRGPYHGSRLGVSMVRETAALWGALRAVDARAYVVRGSGLKVAMMGEFCRLARRGLVFSSANDFDLLREPISGSRVKHRIYLHGLRRADSVVVQSRQQLELAKPLLRGRQALEQIPSFAETAAPRVDRDSFLWVSRISAYKQPLEFIRLARALPEARFTMVDAASPDSDGRLLEQLHREAEGLNNLELTGPLRREEVLARLDRTVAIVSTSVWEGMPNVFLEAWARSVPALTLSFDPDGLIDGRDMGIAARGSWESFAKGASSLWSDPSLCDRMGANCRTYLEQNHAPRAVGERWERVLDEVMA
jgi:glycosyltransferase involved in cell wall biosynthesis